MLKANVKDNFQGQRLIIWGQGQDQGLETQDQGHGQLASRILEDSISDVHKKHTAYTVHLVHHLILDKTFSDWRIGGSQDPPPLATPMLLYIYSVDDWTDTMLIGHRDTVRAWRLSIIKLQLVQRHACQINTWRELGKSCVTWRLSGLYNISNISHSLRVSNNLREVLYKHVV